jgi:hypothetical protein
MLKQIYSIIFVTIATIALYGVAIPWAVSFKDNLIATAGVIVAACGIPLLIVFIFNKVKRISKIIKENTK